MAAESSLSSEEIADTNLPPVTDHSVAKKVPGLRSRLASASDPLVRPPVTAQEVERSIKCERAIDQA